MRVRASSLDDIVFSVVFRFRSKDFAKSSATTEGERRGDGLLKEKTGA